MEKHNYVQGSLFEEDYLIRTLGAVVHSPDIALTELVANAWDAGASFVNITIPVERGKSLIVEDDGIGLTKEQFHKRWMKLGYNRVKNQGDKVVFPSGRKGNRIAYGRNGIGRHGMLCFAKEYVVVTKNNGQECLFKISTESEELPFVIKTESMKDGVTGNGTKLEVEVKKNLPDAQRILDVISARFLHDPQFRVVINGESILLEDHKGLINSKDVCIENINLKMHFIDSLKSARKTLYQGIAFWQAGRLIGEPSWILGKESVLDGRTRFAKQYTVIVRSNDLAEYVNEDWTGFKPSSTIDKIYLAVTEYVNTVLTELVKTQIGEIKSDVKKEFTKEIIGLSALGKYEVDEAIEMVTSKYPTVKPEALSLAVEAVINMEKSRSGRELLEKLSNFSEEDIDGLNRLLSQWTVKDALCVLDEIDRRLSTIEAIRKLSEDPNVDELKVLHPLITEARWLFGPEFDSPEYVSNRQLQTAARQLFKVENGKDIFINPKKRPDLIVIDKYCISLTGTEIFDTDRKLAVVNRILIVELKRGGFELTRAERNQLQGYVEDLISCGVIHGNPFIHAFLVGMKTEKRGLSGMKVNDRNDDNKEIGKITIATFSQLVDTAEQRLFGLRKTLNDRYDDIPGLDLHARSMQHELRL